MATAVARYTAAAITDRGRKRTSNEDAFGYSIEHGVYLVCYGMGGAAAGEIASSVAVEEFLRLVTERREAEEQAPLDAPSESLPDIGKEAIVAANQAIRGALQDVAAKAQTTLIIPPPALCTDNGAMIAWAGAERLALGMIDTMDAPPRARWRLDETAVAPEGFANTRAGF